MAGDDAAVSPYDAGLSYYMDEYTAAVEKGSPYAWRGMMVSEGLGYPLVRVPREETVPMNWRGMMTSEGIGNVPPSTQALPSNDASGQDTSTLQSVINFAHTIWSNWTAGAARDATRENRATLVMDFAVSGSVLGAQICLAGPANVASNEDPYWTAAQKAIQQQRPDVWAEAEQAGGWWPVGEQFDMLKERQQMAAALSSVGITVNQAAISQPFSTTPVPFQVTVSPGVAPPPQPGQPVTPPKPGTPAPPVATGGPTTSVPLLAGSSSTLMVLALAGAAYYAIRKRA